MTTSPQFRGFSSQACSILPRGDSVLAETSSFYPSGDETGSPL